MSLRCVKFAFQGIAETVRTEHNFRFMLGVFGAVVAAGAVLGLSGIEWALLLVCCGMSLGAELINTAIEAAVDVATLQKNPLAKKAKDAASGASIVVCAFSAAVGLVIFIPRIVSLF